ncbi:bifunctional phosphopantothenoylcysteine decarboxylase/phosphopantothenate--cysteine ligase CoaBC [Flaviaesturariibacter flavus]|uniref:Coenzyme A biosynthesis bifunctional protein CoaBC n=1 Tax=Flaviaesturariibacter flavus TaxID=2502780 RepID=A0A4R1BK07_9BACT|nr:bifunctional phosphopantothenoylcysteine decarboxylase/phosphopantothenate--cysteine ligase CoaBC [Flaviaesturariibacter flavus]TCJ17745.1 bifunctional phosphopantothenoylcysteine decarboxylase/phosphopantothenate--cysteine ligase CoaBC [Flaviaesturariibacter flavus]
MSLSGKKVLIGITGSIAAYKIPILVRLLVKEGAEVRLLMTGAAKDFVSELTLSTLSKAPVLSKLFDEGAWANHVALGRWADLFVVAPLSCNTLAKMASGQCDNLLLATWLSATCPVVIAPAMDEDMWLHGSTKDNLQKLASWGVQMLPVEHGELASGLIGPGRMAEPETIRDWIARFFESGRQLAGKKVLVTAGPTYEALDPVRFIGNHSSGKMGYALAGELAARGAEVHLVSGPVALKPLPGVQLLPVRSARQMYEASLALADYDIAVMAAAVADYTPVNVSGQKIKKTEGELTLNLRKTDDILATLGARKEPGQLLVGFALETEQEEAHAEEKLRRKGADLIVLNSLNDAGAGFGTDTNKVTLFYKDGQRRALPLQSKQEAARAIVDAITELMP